MHTMESNIWQWTTENTEFNLLFYHHFCPFLRRFQPLSVSHSFVYEYFNRTRSPIVQLSCVHHCRMLMEGNPECFSKIRSNRIKTISIHSSTQHQNWRKKYAWTWARSRARATIVIIIRFFPQSFDDLQMKLNKIFAFHISKSMDIAYAVHCAAHYGSDFQLIVNFILFNFVRHR